MNGVPDIEDELSFLAEDKFDEETDKNTIKKTLAPNPNAEYHHTYLKFIEGKKDDTPPLNARHVKRTTESKTIPEATPPAKPPEEFPPDPEDDPRYYPLPKSSDQRSFDTSDSEQDLENDKKEKPSQECKKENSEEDTDKKKSNDDTKSVSHSDAEKDTVNVSDTSDSNEDSISRRNLPQRKTRSSRLNKKLLDVLQDDESDVEGSDPVWIPNEDEFDSSQSKRTRKNKKKWSSSSSYSYSSDDDEYRPSKKSKKKNLGKKKFSFSRVGRPPQTSLVAGTTVAREKQITHTIITPPPIIPKPAVSDKDNPLFPHKPNEFLVASCDRKYYNPPLWRVRENNMLQRFIHFVKNGAPFYCNVPSFTAWSAVTKVSYEQVEVKYINQIKRDITVKLTTKNLHQVTTNTEIVEQKVKECQIYQDHFEIFIQALISQVLGSKFLSEVVNEKDDFFLSNIAVIDEYCDELIKRMISTLSWPEELITATTKFPTYMTKLSPEKCICGESSEVAISLEGFPYDYKTLEPSTEDIQAVNTVLCKMCYEYFQILHKLCHFKKYTLAICEVEVTSKREEDITKNPNIILNELLADNDWLCKMFLDACNLWAYGEKVLVDISQKNVIEV